MLKIYMKLPLFGHKPTCRVVKKGEGRPTKSCKEDPKKLAKKKLNLLKSVLKASKMSSLSEMPSYTLIHVPSDVETPSEAQLKSDLEKGDAKTKVAALKKTIQMILNGDKVNNILMTVIRFVLPSQVSEGRATVIVHIGRNCLD